VRHLGVSNFTPTQFELLASRLDLPLVTSQVELHPLSELGHKYGADTGAPVP